MKIFGLLKWVALAILIFILVRAFLISTAGATGDAAFVPPPAPARACVAVEQRLLEAAEIGDVILRHGPRAQAIVDRVWRSFGWAGIPKVDAVVVSEIQFLPLVGVMAVKNGRSCADVVVPASAWERLFKPP